MMDAPPFKPPDPPPPAPRSFAAAVRAPSGGFFKPIQLAPRQYGTKDGCPAVSFTPSEIQEGASRLQHTLVAKFTGGRPHIEDVRKAFLSAWSLHGEASIGAWDARHVLIVLKSEHDADLVFSSPIRKVQNYWFRLFRWTPDFHTHRESTLTTAWLKLQALPPHMYDIGIIKSLVSSFGKFIGVDDKTKNFSNPSFARVCVEVDLSTAVPEKIWVSSGVSTGFWLQIEYESKLLYCSKCRIHGHLLSSCRKNNRKPPENRVTEARPVIQNGGNPGISITDNQGDMENQGEWRVVSKRKGSKSRIQNPLHSDSVIKAAEATFLATSIVEKPLQYRDETQAWFSDPVSFEIQINSQNDVILADGSVVPVVPSPTADGDYQVGNDSDVAETDNPGTAEKNTDQSQRPRSVGGPEKAVGGEVPNDKNQAVPTSRDPKVNGQMSGPTNETLLMEEDQNNIVMELLPEDKFDPYNNSDIMCYDKDENPLDARAVYLLLKAKHDDEAHIFQIMDDIYNVATQPQKEDSNSPIEESDGSIDLSRILKKPRQKTKGTRHSGRSRPKKKDPNYVY